jgi:hypothetical protein
MPNIFGTVNEGLTNPLTENLQGADFNIYDINELHLNELHDQDGIDKIKVHEDFNMLNNQITNMADPTQNKDAATKSYVDSVAGGGTIFYDVWAAYGDETTPIVAGVQPVIIYPPRDFTASSISGSLSATATSNSFEVQVKVNSTVIGTITFLSGTPTANTSISPNIQINQNQLITANCVLGDATAAGLKISINGIQL